MTGPRAAAELHVRRHWSRSQHLRGVSFWSVLQVVWIADDARVVK